VDLQNPEYADPAQEADSTPVQNIESPGLIQQEEAPPSSVKRSSRAHRPPSYLKDYVLTA